eukprot:GFUD01004317.1.p1 GENE.GFUD01004317.1~~GFUD01004317.1.p1  ORF type:complete len:280 (+),score=52.03 GFUD01004317.1:44-883(+)
MLLKASPEHPLFDFLQTEGSQKLTDTRLVGNSFYFVCHGLLVLPISMISPPYPTSSEKLTVLLPPEVKQEDVLNYLTYVYSGILPSSPEEIRGFLRFVEILWSDSVLGLPDIKGAKTPESVRSDEMPEVPSGQGDVNANVVDNSDAIKVVKQNNPTKKMKVLKVVEVPDNIKCDACDKLIKFKRNLARHMLLAHQKEVSEKLECEFCNLVFFSRFNLNRHLNSKNCLNNLTAECKECKMRFESEDKLKSHQAKNCSKKYFCSECLTFFKTKKFYQNHSH